MESGKMEESSPRANADLSCRRLLYPRGISYIRVFSQHTIHVPPKAVAESLFGGSSLKSARFQRAVTTYFLSSGVTSLVGFLVENKASLTKRINSVDFLCPSWSLKIPWDAWAPFNHIL